MDKQIRIWSFSDVDRSGKVRWAALELGYEVDENRVTFEEVGLDPYRELNPYALVPTAEVDGEVFIESTAICLLLAERHPDADLVPAAGPVRERFWQSLGVSTHTLEMPVVLYFLGRAGFLDAAWGDLWAPSLEKRLPVFAADMPDEGHICGAFTIADICAAYVLRIGVQAGLLRYEGKTASYLDRLRARPAASEARFFNSLDS